MGTDSQDQQEEGLWGGEYHGTSAPALDLVRKLWAERKMGPEVYTRLLSVPLSA